MRQEVEDLTTRIQELISHCLKEENLKKKRELEDSIKVFEDRISAIEVESNKKNLFDQLNNCKRQIENVHF